MEITAKSRFFNKNEETEDKKMTEKAGEKDALTKVVKLMIPRDASNPQESDVSITVNGNTFLIQRGVQVDVPQYVAEVYYNSQEQLCTAHRYRSEAEQE